MAKKIALQLYSIRDVKLDYETKIRKVAAMGYPAVETAGFPGSSAEAAAKLFKELGLTVSSAHVGLPVGEAKNQILETMEALGKPPLICTQIGPNDVKTMDTIKSLCDRLNQGYAVAKENGLVFGIHNHWWEFDTVDGRLAHDVMLELLDPGVLFEIDTYWVKVGGSDPVQLLKKLGKRAPFLHIKDGPAVKDQPMTAVGDGVMDVPAILKAALPDAWEVVEMDSCATDVMVAAKKSYDYLASL
jgi:sugar phosphate isomerase/epimerase